MIILDQKLWPLIRVITPQLNTYALQNRIEEYLHENSLALYHQGKIVNALPVTGQSQSHAKKLASYLNRDKETGCNFQIVKGYFVSEDIEHFWLQVDNLLIDIAIRQFANFPQLNDNPLQAISDYAYLICDNTLDPIYQLYFEEVV